VVVAVGLTVVEPLASVEVKVPGAMAMLVAPVTAQVSVLLAPELIVAGLAANKVITGGEPGPEAEVEIVEPQPEKTTETSGTRSSAQRFSRRIVQELRRLRCVERGLREAITAFSLRAHEAKIGVGAEVSKIREYLLYLAIGETEPAREGSCVLVDGSGGYEAASSDVVCLVRTDDGILAIHIVALDSAADNEVMTAPAVVGAVAVAGEGAAEVGGSEGGDLVAETRGLHESIEVLESLTELG
jgi:hypothetical protein